MILKNDRNVTIAIGANRRSKKWINTTMLISELWEKFRKPIKSTETLQTYLALPKHIQDDLKDVSGFIGGKLNGCRRTANNVIFRDIITLDLDNILSEQYGKIITCVNDFECSYLIYSTRKHKPIKPRLRILIPLKQSIDAKQYSSAARIIAKRIGIEFFDPTTFDVSRFMYWPSCCNDSEYIYLVGDKPLLDTDKLLKEIAVKLYVENIETLLEKQDDPEQKTGIVALFCRRYNIYRVIEELLPGIYTKSENNPYRYTYIKSSTEDGAVVYDNGKFLYSHHASDPCHNKLVNSFDLVRIHKFGYLDTDVKSSIPSNHLPSYVSMCKFVNNLNINTNLSEHADHNNWYDLLEKNAQNTNLKNTINNILLILKNDPKLNGKFAFNTFINQIEVLGITPWDKNINRRLFSDNDNQGLYWYLEKYYHINRSSKIDSALSLYAHEFSFNDLQNYLNSLKDKWDKKPRLDTILIDYLGAKDTEYTRTVTRKIFTAAVTRAMEPGCKFDNMLILVGTQGIGKSTLLDKMSRGWFNDNIRTFEGKEASELLQGTWIIEISELDAFRRTDVSRIKQFLSLRTDRFRATYGRNVQEIPRSCVFFGTTNNIEFLQDKTGNRRFWTVDVGLNPHSLNVWKDLDKNIDQLWAEAFVNWQNKEPLILTGKMEQTLKLNQESHRELSSREGIIRDFLKQYIPDDWNRWSLEKRRAFWNNSSEFNVALVPRTKICAIEVWCEALGGDILSIKNSDAKEINAVIASTEGWKRLDQPIYCSIYGSQRSFINTSYMV